MRWQMKIGMAALAGGVAAMAAPAMAVSVIDFENYATGAEIGGTIAPGVDLKVTNYNGDLHMGVAWDANGFLHKPRVRGSSTPWLTGNLPALYDPGQGLMIQGIGSVIPRPEGLRAAGEFVFTFSTPGTSFGFDVFDIDGPKEFNSPNGYFVTFFSGNQILAGIQFADLITPNNPFYDPTIKFGEASANRIATVTSAQLGGTFDAVRITMGGSGFIDNIRYSVIPSPAAAGAGIALALMGFSKRRRD